MLKFLVSILLETEERFMAFIKKPVTGMRDILPDEMAVRNYLMGIIRDTYRAYGFSQIETPVVEHIENLTGKQGGENEKLIFKIMKRGEKLSSEGEALKGGDFDALSDSGLRYDLTLPLARYYANNASKLPQPFKALQMGPVFRADRPQRGRFRQFMQCDIDILGDDTNLAEKELITATTEALSKLGFDKHNYKIILNDRRILFGMLKYAGFPEEDHEKILIILDKADKIGAEGVDEELKASGYSEDMIRRLRDLLSLSGKDREGVRRMSEAVDDPEVKAACENLTDIMDSIAAVRSRNIKLEFVPTLVRGMGYYTGTIFEIQVESFGSSVGGGGRYDKMIGKFTGKDVPAVGFSIGFERIMTLLMEEGFEIPENSKKTVYLVEKGMPSDRLGEIFNEAIERRSLGERILVTWMNKNKKFQKEQLTKEGYTEFKDFYREELKR